MRSFIRAAPWLTSRRARTCPTTSRRRIPIALPPSSWRTPMSDQAERLRNLVRQFHAKQPARRGRVVTVTSGKGGVGKSSLAINLSLAMQQMGWRVMLFDADLGLSNVDVMLGLTPAEELTEVLRRGAPLERCLMEGPLGLQVISGGSGFYELANLSDDRLARLVAQLAQLDAIDRKSTRLNSSHVRISYAVFCLKKKNTYAIVIGSKHITLNSTVGGFLTASNQFRHGATSKSRSNTACNSTKRKCPHLSCWRLII